MTYCSVNKSAVLVSLYHQSYGPVSSVLLSMYLQFYCPGIPSPLDPVSLVLLSLYPQSYCPCILSPMVPVSSVILSLYPQSYCLCILSPIVPVSPGPIVSVSPVLLSLYELGSVLIFSLVLQAEIGWHGNQCSVYLIIGTIKPTSNEKNSSSWPTPLETPAT